MILLNSETGMNNSPRVVRSSPAARQVERLADGVPLASADVNHGEPEDGADGPIRHEKAEGTQPRTPLMRSKLARSKRIGRPPPRPAPVSGRIARPATRFRLPIA